jgi:hypothetical protein
MVKLKGAIKEANVVSDSIKDVCKTSGIKVTKLLLCQ